MEMVEGLEEFLQTTEVKDKYQLSFIDLMEDDLSPYENEKIILDKGYQLPITFIAGKPAFSGKVDFAKTYEILKKL